MIGTNFASYIRLRTKTNATTLPDADLVLLANVVKDDLAALIATNVNEHFFDMEMVRDLEADVRDYTFEDDLLKNVSYVSATLDGTNPLYLIENDWGEAEYNRIALMDETLLRAHYAGRKPEYIITGRSLRLLSNEPIIAVTEGLKVIAEVFPENIDSADLALTTDLSIPSTDTQHRLPRAAHRVWAKMVVVEYKTSREKPLPLTEDDAKLEVDLSELYKTLRKRNAVRSVIAKVPSDDGQRY